MLRTSQPTSLSLETSVCTVDELTHAPFGSALEFVPAPVGRMFLPDYALPLVSVVIPALNEAKNLPYVLPRIPAWVHEVVLVPGHSSDDTVAVARELWPAIRVVEQQG